MMRDEKIEQRAKELMKEGIPSEVAVGIAVAEQILKEQETEQAEQAKQAEIYRVIKDGEKVVSQLSTLHQRLENEATEDVKT